MLRHVSYLQTACKSPYTAAEQVIYDREKQTKKASVRGCAGACVLRVCKCVDGSHLVKVPARTGIVKRILRVESAVGMTKANVSRNQLHQRRLFCFPCPYSPPSFLLSFNPVPARLRRSGCLNRSARAWYHHALKQLLPGASRGSSRGGVAGVMARKYERGGFMVCEEWQMLRAARGRRREEDSEVCTSQGRKSFASSLLTSTVIRLPDAVIRSCPPFCGCPFACISPAPAPL